MGCLVKLLNLQGGAPYVCWWLINYKPSEQLQYIYNKHQSTIINPSYSYPTYNQPSKVGGHHQLDSKGKYPVTRMLSISTLQESAASVALLLESVSAGVSKHMVIRCHNSACLQLHSLLLNMADVYIIYRVLHYNVYIYRVVVTHIFGD